MNNSLAGAVGSLIEKDELGSYTDNGKNISIKRKQCGLTIQIINKEARAKKKKSIYLEKTYDYPKDLERDVCWDVILTWKGHQRELTIKRRPLYCTH